MIQISGKQHYSEFRRHMIDSFLHFLGGTSQPTQHWLHSFYVKENPRIVFFQDNLIKRCFAQMSDFFLPGSDSRLGHSALPMLA